jgi:hypothetical protein
MGGPEVVGNSGYTNAELAAMFAAFPIPSNVQFEIEFAKGLSFKTPTQAEAPVTISSTPVTKPVVSDIDAAFLKIYETQLTEEYRSKTSFKDFKDAFEVMKGMGLPAETIIKNMCK